MSKRFETPTSRLICFGGARAHTNSPLGGPEIEDDVPTFYTPA